MRIPALLAILLLTGCAGYHIGPVKPKFMGEIRTLAVPTFQNETLEPRLEALIANSVIKQIQQDGTYAIAPLESADAILEGTVSDVERKPRRSVRGNVLATREFVIDLKVEYKLRERSTGLELHSGTVIGSTSFFVGRDLQQEERQAIPLAAEDAAVRLTSALSEGW